MTKRVCSRALTLAALVGMLPSWALGQGAAGPVEQLKSYRFGPDRSVLDAVSAAVAKARLDPALKPQAARELASVLQSEASFDAKQFALRQIVFVAGPEQAALLAGLLGQEKLAHYALMALAQIPGAAVDQTLVKSLDTSSGPARVEVILVLGKRQISAATSKLVPLLREQDPATAEAAATALGRIATPAAVMELRKALPRANDSQRLSLSDALLDAARLLEARGDAAGAAGIYTLLDQPSSPPAIRAGALRGLVGAQGETALPLLLKALAEDGTRRQSAAFELARRVKGKEVVRELTRVLPNLSEKAQLAVLAVLADRGEWTPVNLADVVKAPNRVAALETMGAVSGSEGVGTLLHYATKGTAEEKAAARRSLALVRHTVAETVLVASLKLKDPAERTEVIRALGERRTLSAVPDILKEARSTEPSVRAAALRVLRDLARPEDLPALVDTLLATPAGERDEAVSSITEVARRDASGQSTGLLVARLSSAQKAEDRTDLLAILGQVGGPQALAALRSALADPAVRTGAVSQLAEWPTDEPMPDLLAVVRSGQDASDRAVALRGYIRMIGMGEGRSQADALKLYREAAGLARSAADRRLILAGLGKSGSLETLEFAAGFLPDTEVRPEAELAVVEIGRALSAAYPDRVKSLLEPIARESGNEETRRRAGEALAAIERLGEYVLAWEVSPAYSRPNTEYTRLFDVAFPPEEKDAATSVAWRVMPAVTNKEQPWLLDLLALHGGEQRVAYLRTAVHSETERDVVLELGSDDGIKVWWNGRQVAANNTARAVAPGQEKVRVRLKAGWNQLLLKVTQNNQGWGAVARIANPDGTRATGLRFALPSAVKE